MRSRGSLSTAGSLKGKSTAPKEESVIFHCRCCEELEKSSGLKIEFDIILNFSAPGLRTQKKVTADVRSTQGSEILCPFCGSVLKLHPTKEAPMKK